MAEVDARQLPALARAVSDNAHAPFSRVRVGAAVLSEGGKVYTGCNVESASYGLTQCAERNALAAAVADGALPGSLIAMAVYANGFAVLSPCGACRQVISELMAPGAEVTSCCDNKETRTWTVAELLPYPFVLE